MGWTGATLIGLSSSAACHPSRPLVGQDRPRSHHAGDERSIPHDCLPDLLADSRLPVDLDGDLAGRARCRRCLRSCSRPRRAASVCRYRTASRDDLWRFAPLIATWLIAQTVDPLSPSFYLIFTAELSMLALSFTGGRSHQRRAVASGIGPHSRAVVDVAARPPAGATSGIRHARRGCCRSAALPRSGQFSMSFGSISPVTATSTAVPIDGCFSAN